MDKILGNRSYIGGLAWVLVVLPLCLTNCSEVTHNGSGQQKTMSSTSAQDGGTGLEGNHYISYATCPSGGVKIKTEIVTTADHSQAKYVKQNCQELGTPIAIDPTKLEFSPSDPAVLVVDNELFDLWTGHANQKVTLHECRMNAGQLPDLLLSGRPSQPSTLYAVLMLEDGTTTGKMDAQATAGGFSGGNNVAAFAIDLSTSTLNYVFSGQATVLVPGMQCFSQELPPPGNYAHANHTCH